MDNNFNQQVPQNQQPVYQQQIPQQPVYQQQPMYQQAPQRPSNTNTMGMIALIASGVGAFLAILGSILTCSCSASKTFDAKNAVLGTLSGDMHSTSLVWLVAFFGAIIAAAGAVLAILDIKKSGKDAKLAYVALAVGGFGFLYGMLSFLTICGYNCSLNSSYEDMISSSIGSFFK